MATLGVNGNGQGNTNRLISPASIPVFMSNKSIGFGLCNNNKCRRWVWTVARILLFRKYQKEMQVFRSVQCPTARPGNDFELIAGRQLLNEMTFIIDI